MERKGRIIKSLEKSKEIKTLLRRVDFQRVILHRCVFLNAGSINEKAEQQPTTTFFSRGLTKSSIYILHQRGYFHKPKPATTALVQWFRSRLGLWPYIYPIRQGHEFETESTTSKIPNNKSHSHGSGRTGRLRPSREHGYPETEERKSTTKEQGL